MKALGNEAAQAKEPICRRWRGGPAGCAQRGEDRRGCPDFGKGREGRPDIWGVRVIQAEGTAGTKALWWELGRCGDPRGQLGAGSEQGLRGEAATSQWAGGHRGVSALTPREMGGGPILFSQVPSGCCVERPGWGRGQEWGLSPGSLQGPR